MRESIRAARQARQRTSDEFAAFIKGFRTPASTPISEDVTAASRASETRQQATAESPNRSNHSPDPLPDPSPSTVVAPLDTDSVADTMAAPASAVPQRYRLGVRSAGILVIIAVTAVVLVSTRRGGEPHRRQSSMPSLKAQPRRGTQRRRPSPRRRNLRRLRLLVASRSNCACSDRSGCASSLTVARMSRYGASGSNAPVGRSLDCGPRRQRRRCRGANWGSRRAVRRDRAAADANLLETVMAAA